MNSLNVDFLLRDTYTFWWPGAMMLILVLAFGLVYRKAWWLQVTVGAGAFIVMFVALASGYGQLLPQEGAKRDVSSDPTQQSSCWNVSRKNPLALANKGEALLFGGVGKSKEVGAIGKAQCAACHTFHQGQSDKQAPTLYRLPQRVSEGFQTQYRETEPSLASDKQAYATRLANDTLEYMALSTACHECFVLPEWEGELRSARSGKDHAKLNAVFELTSDELMAITAWLYFRDGETPPACPDEVSHIFRKALEINRYGVRNKFHILAAPIPYQK